MRTHEKINEKLQQIQRELKRYDWIPEMNTPLYHTTKDGFEFYVTEGLISFGVNDTEINFRDDDRGYDFSTGIFPDSEHFLTFVNDASKALFVFLEAHETINNL